MTSGTAPFPLFFLFRGRDFPTCLSRLGQPYRDSLFAKPGKVYIKEFLQAGYIAAQVLDRPLIQHLHGHFCHGATTITWFVSRLTGIPFSFTAHAKDIYQGDLNLEDKIDEVLHIDKDKALKKDFEGVLGLLAPSTPQPRPTS